MPRGTCFGILETLIIYFLFCYVTGTGQKRKMFDKKGHFDRHTKIIKRQVIVQYNDVILTHREIVSSLCLSFK